MQMTNEKLLSEWHVFPIENKRCLDRVDEPYMADRTSQILSSGQKHVTNQASICFKFSYGRCSALDMFIQLIHAIRQVNVTANDRPVSLAQYRNFTVIGPWSLLSGCLRPTQRDICLTSAHDTLFEPHWPCEADRIMFLHHCLESWNESKFSRFFKTLCSHEIFGFRCF